MDKLIESNFRFHNYKVDYINYLVNPNYESDGEPIKVSFAIDIEVAIDEEQPRGKVTLAARIFEDAFIKNYPFSLEVSITGYFSTDDTTMPKTKFGEFCETNGTTALFPFLRSTVADISKIGNINPLILPLVNIHRLIEYNKQKVESDN